MGEYKKPILRLDLKVGDILRHNRNLARTLRVVQRLPKGSKIVYVFIKTDEGGTREISEEYDKDSSGLTNNYYLDKEAMDRVELTKDMEELFNGT